MLFSTLSNTGETEILLFTCDLSGKRLKFLYIYNIESLDLFQYLPFLNRFSDMLHCCKIIFLQLMLLGKTSEEPNFEHLIENV